MSAEEKKHTTRSAEEVGKAFETAGWMRETEGNAVFYTKEVSPAVIDKIREIARRLKKK